MTLKPSLVETDSILLSDLAVGQQVDATVKKIETYGMFLRIKGSLISGLAHKNEIADHPIENLASVYSVGDVVKAVILKIDADKKRVSFGLRSSYFENRDSSDEEELEEVEEEEDAYEAMSVDSDDKVEDAMEVEDDIPALNMSSSFDWSDQPKGHSDAVEALAPSTPSAPLTQTKKQKVQAVTPATRSSNAPTTAADYDRLLLGEPNSSFLWINYMAFHLQLSEIEKARQVAEKALKTINFREEEERMNMWVALLNLESKYGTQDDVDGVFKRAIQFANAKKIHLALVKIYESTQKSELAEELFKRITKKFSGSCKAWWLFGQFYLLNGQHQQARDLLQSALRSLPKRKHVKTILKFAQLEYKHGEFERGRTMFEGVLATYPKRIDLWSVYIDKEIGMGDVASVRRLFERATSLSLSSKKAKFFFKKWLEWEKSRDDMDGIEVVKQRAMAYVQAQ